jgi:cation diffusion facilitator CzcD-associated flavoprotein CzcO
VIVVIGQSHKNHKQKPTTNQIDTQQLQQPTTTMCSPNDPPTVAVIGCGPSGMFFLHALATQRRQQTHEGVLPIVTCYESSSAPGGVWRSDRIGNTTNMYEALWTNGPHYAMVGSFQSVCYCC